MDVSSLGDSASELTTGTVTSHAIDLPASQGISVLRLPSSLTNRQLYSLLNGGKKK